MFTHQTLKFKTLEKSIGVKKETLALNRELLECIRVLLTWVNRRPADSLPSGSRSGQHQEETRHGGAGGPGQAVCLRQWVLNQGVGGAGGGAQSCDPGVQESINSSGVCIVIRQYLAAALIVNHLLFHFPHCFSWWTILSVSCPSASVHLNWCRLRTHISFYLSWSRDIYSFHRAQIYSTKVKTQACFFNHGNYWIKLCPAK